MKFGNVSTLLLTLSPWYDGHYATAVAAAGSASNGDHGLSVPPPFNNRHHNSNVNLPDSGHHAIRTAMVAPPRGTATNLATSNANGSSPLSTTIFSVRTVRRRKLSHPTSAEHAAPQHQLPVEHLLHVGSVAAATSTAETSSAPGDQTNAVAVPAVDPSGWRPRQGWFKNFATLRRRKEEIVGPISALKKQPMVVLRAVADRVVDNRTDESSAGQHLLTPLVNTSEFNATTTASPWNFTSRWRDSSEINSTFSTLTGTLSYTWNWTAAALDEINSQIGGGSNSGEFEGHLNLTSGVGVVDYISNDDVTSATITSPAIAEDGEGGFEFGDTAARSAALAVLLALFCAFTVFGNVLVMAAVARERYLHTVTNYFVVSLATADCLVGALVMPFSVVHETMSRVWIFGRDWCDVWHSLDVLASTASILNLCVISLDRYWAITDPITYPSKMTTRRAVILIAAVWVCASLISFPAIAWWRAVSPNLIVDNTSSGTTATSASTSAWFTPHAAASTIFSSVPSSPGNVGPACTFTEDIGYLVFSSIISFYGPLTVMVFTYYRIYRAAAEQTRSLRLGTKQVLACNGEESMELTLRIHRGGGGGSGGGASGSAAPAHTNGNGGGGRRGYHPSSPPADYLQHGSDTHSNSSCSSSVRVVPKNLKHFSFSRKLARLAKEQKAAKTLGIVMGVFVLCWMPFFLCNVLVGLCPDSCFRDPALVSSVVTWLGWINSGMNPVIYACWSRDFRRAFTKILCGCCPRLMVLDGGVAGGHRTMRHRLRSRVCQSAGTPLSSTCSAECVRL